jgi:RNA polymerase sigma factor (sigma-70 family)
MDDLAEADRYLLDQIARGDPDAWGQLVGRYHGRLLAFARGRVGRRADAEDLVQDTFAAFLQSFRSFRRDASLETYLFTILRRRLIDVFRGRGTGGLKVCSIHDAGGPDGDADDRPPPADRLAAPDPAASWYARRDEEHGRLSAALSAAVRQLADRFKDVQNLRDLKVVEALFYAQLRNTEVAAACGVSEGHVAVVKHRCLKEVRDRAAAALAGGGLARGGIVGGDAADRADDPRAADLPDSLLTDVWERLRPTCPKRSTLGRYVLGTLGPEWQEYVTFHATVLGCRFCAANLDDLRKPADDEASHQLPARFFQSTVGFLTRA